MKKEVYAIILIGVMALSLCACGEQKSGPVKETSIQQEESSSDENSTNNSAINTDTPKLVDYVGSYYGGNGTDTITLIAASGSEYQLTDMVIDNEIYYVNGQRHGNSNEMSTTFSAEVGEKVTISTYYGCEGTVTLNKDGSISLTLSLNGKFYSGTFTK